MPKESNKGKGWGKPKKGHKKVSSTEESESVYHQPTPTTQHRLPQGMIPMTPHIHMTFRLLHRYLTFSSHPKRLRMPLVLVENMDHKDLVHCPKLPAVILQKRDLPLLIQYWQILILFLEVRKTIN